MEDVWEDEPEYAGRTAVRSKPVNVDRQPLANKLRGLEQELSYLKKERESSENTKKFRFPFKWNSKFNASKRKVNIDKVLVLFLNKKNEIEAPMFIPIYSGNIIIYKNKPYEFDPRGIWRLKGVKGYPSVYLIREIDRRPLINPKTGAYVRDSQGRIVFSKDAAISNMDIDDVRARGDSTESDEFLIKAALKAYTGQKISKPVNWMVIIIVLILVGVGAFFLLRSNIGG